jgi:outer membrane scaffolding protein for murein synthesis (MipA/OmpV family)
MTHLKASGHTARAIAAVLALIVSMLLTTAPALGLDSTLAGVSSLRDSGQSEGPSALWDVKLGLGVVGRPTYLGSDRYQAAPLLFMNITYDDWIALDAGTLGAYWHHDGLRVGGGVTYDDGRKDHKTNGLFTQGDARLSGLGNIPGALGLKVFASYSVGFVVVDSAFTRLAHSGNEGFCIDASVAAPYPVGNQLTISPHVATKWSSASYMEARFGITPQQAATSAFAEFRTSPGFQDVALGADATILMSAHWFARLSINEIKLLGGAGRSPIALSATDSFAAVSLGHKF